MIPKESWVELWGDMGSLSAPSGGQDAAAQSPSCAFSEWLFVCQHIFLHMDKRTCFPGENTIVHVCLGVHPASIAHPDKDRSTGLQLEFVSTAKGNIPHFLERPGPTLVSQPPADTEQRQLLAVSKRGCHYNICQLLLSAWICGEPSGTLFRIISHMHITSGKKLTQTREKVNFCTHC